MTRPSKRTWLIVFIAWRATIAVTLVGGAIVVQDWRSILLSFASGAMAVDSAYLVSAARGQFRRPAAHAAHRCGSGRRAIGTTPAPSRAVLTASDEL